MDIMGFGARDELLKRVADSVMLFCDDARHVHLEQESFRRFSEYMGLLQALVRELTARRVERTPEWGTTTAALQQLETEISKARETLKTYGARSRLSRLLVYRDVLSKLQRSAHEICRAIESLSLGNLDSTLRLKSKAEEIVHGLESVEFKSAAATEAIITEIAKSAAEDGRSRDHTSRLLHQISDAIGATTRASLGREMVLLKQEKEELEARKQHAEALQFAQLIHLLSRTEMIPIPRGEGATPPASDNFIGSFTCPISGELMQDPVAVVCGHSFERKAILEYFELGQRTCPTCGELLSSQELTRNISLQNSIQEWQKRSLKVKMRNAMSDLASSEPDTLNQALETLLAAMEVPGYIAEISQLYPVTKLVAMLKNNAEAIAAAGAVRCIVKKFCRGETEPEALQVLLGLSENEKLADLIGNTKDCIPSLVSLAQNSVPAISEKALHVLSRLSSKTHFVIQMAQAGHVRPFLTSFQQVNTEGRAQMATALTRMQLLENTARHLESEQFIGTLTKSLYSCVCKPACLGCIKRLTAFPGVVQKLVLDRDIIPALLGLMHSTTSEQQWKQDAVEILISLVGASQPDDYCNNPSLQELHSLHNIRVFLHTASASSPQTKCSCLRLLVLMATKSSDARELMRCDRSMISCLFSTLSGDHCSEVRLQVLRLIRSIAEEHPGGVPLPPSPEKEDAVNTLINVFTSSPGMEERSAAAGIIGRLPSDDAAIDEMLHRSEILKAIHEVICAAEGSNNHHHVTMNGPIPWQPTMVIHCLLENVLASLLRCIEPKRTQLQRQALKLDLSTSLIRVLSTGSSLAKKQAIIALCHLSQSGGQTVTGSAIDLMDQKDGLLAVSQLQWIFRMKSWCGFSSELSQSLCSVHGSACSRHTFCLVKAGALGPLVQIVNEAESVACEAALVALETLIREERTASSASMAIAESQGVAAILRLLQHNSPLPTKEKALDLLHSIVKHSEISVEQSPRSKEVLINLLKVEELRKKAALILSQMHDIPQMSSYF
ncbi:Zinc-finger of the MIZ type in Nse subunit [Musa troglodytarum]|uniref:RING-type E3 ubiquitin transferase n=1 Tax=Musa troglodytarum TaxID=320322 RepID=A0A9E7J8L8_9LILI|nr:Zinc-finger of the MIZ type in Nse subunit [Musa troglodytarum]